MPRLFILSGPDTGKSVEVEDGATLGRAVECSVHLRDASVSRQHARLERSESGWRVVDTQSRNGVRVQGERVPAAALADGDEFQVGEVLLRFRIETPSEARTPPPQPAARPGDPEIEEIALEEDPLETLPAPLARTAFSAPPSAPTAPRPASFAPQPGEPVQRGQRILQYHKIPDRQGFFASDLVQQPLWIKIGAGLLAIAVFAAIFFFAFKGTSILKARTTGGFADVSEEKSP